MSDEKILSSEQEEEDSSGFVIANEEDIALKNQIPSKDIVTVEERIIISTESGGLNILPANYDEQYGDWAVINSTDPFKILYLDYKQYVFIKPSLVENNYNILLSFWRDKIGVMNTGGNRVAFKNKYGEGTVENSLHKLKIAFDKLKTEKGIEDYYFEVNNERLRNGENEIMDSIEQMMVDGITDKSEIKICFSRGLNHDLSNDETAVIINKYIEKLGFKPYGKISGNSLLERLLSVDHWMTPIEIEKTDRIRIEQENTKIQILPGKYAKTIQDIGTILFEDELEAKEIIKEDILKPVVAQKDLVIAREIGVISKNSKNLDGTYLEIIYRLNHSLPYRFINNKIANTISDLCAMIFSDPKYIKIGKEHFKKGFIEIWLKENNKVAYEKFLKIRDTAENQELAFIEFLYTFNPTLPYRFAGKILVTGPEDLYKEIDMNLWNWNDGKKELFDGSVPTWFRSSGRSIIAEKWDKIKKLYQENQDAGLEEFLHLLNTNAEYGRLSVDMNSLEFPAIQSGKTVIADLVFTNETRGYLLGDLTLSKPLEGVTISSKDISINSTSGINNSKFTLTIDTSNLLKGVVHETDIHLKVSNTNQEIVIPVSFKIVFPRNAFIIETLKYAVLLTAFFASTRWLVASKYPDWLKNSFSSFLGSDFAKQPPANYSFFGWPFFFFMVGVFLGTYYFVKYLFSTKH